MGLQVNWVLELFGRGLIGTGEACRIGYEIDLHVAFGGDVAGFLIVGKIVAVDLVEAGGIAAVENDADVVQLGVAIELKFLEIAGLDREEGALAIGLGKLEAAGGLLDVIADLAGDLLQHIDRSKTRVKIHAGHDQREQHGSRSQQAAKTIDFERHLGSV